MQKKMALFIFGISTMVGCSPDYTDRDAAIALHDEIMPKMEHFVRADMKIDTLLNRLDSLKSVQPAVDTAQIKQDMLSLKSSIESSNDAMNAWMRQFELEPEGSKQQVEAYFQNQKKAIETVKKQYQQTEQLIQNNLNF